MRIVFLSDIINADDVGMRKSRRGLRFPAEPANEIFIMHKLLAKNLDRDIPVQQNVVGFIDKRHAAAADTRR